MANEVKLPRLGQGMETGNIVKWLKSEGDAVKKGDPLYELDTDKVTQEVEAPADGVLLKIAVSEGEAAVGSVIAFIGEAGEEGTMPEPAAAPAPVAEEASSSTNGASAPEASAAPAAEEAPAAEPGAGEGGGRAPGGGGSPGRRAGRGGGGRRDQGVAACAADRPREGRRALQGARHRPRRADRRRGRRALRAGRCRSGSCDRRSCAPDP